MFKWLNRQNTIDIAILICSIGIFLLCVTTIVTLILGVM